MITKLVLGLMLAGALLIPVAGYAADPYGESAAPSKDVTSNASSIVPRIQARMAEDKMLRSMQIQVDADDAGTVHLSGTANSQEEVERVVTIARGVEGVVTVENKIEVRK